MPIIELWCVSKLEKHRDKYNKVGKRHYSYQNWEMYARKIPLLQVLKYMPTSVEVRNAIAATHAAERGENVSFEGGIVLDGDYISESPDGTIDQATGEVLNTQATQEQQQPAAIGFDYQGTLSRILNCDNVEVLDVIGDDLRDLLEGNDRIKLEAAYQERRTVLDQQ